MAGTVTRSYLRKHSRVRFTNTIPVEATEGFLVEGLTPGPGAQMDIIGATGLPAPWTQHPRFAGLWVVDYEPEMVTNTSAVVVIKYITIAPFVQGVVPAYNIRGGCGLVVKQYDTDRNKVNILLSNQNPNADPKVTVDDRRVEPGVVNVLRPQATIVIERIRPAIPFAGGIDPIAQQVEFVGKTNSLLTLGAAPGTLLCESISYSAEGMLGVAWRMEYEFRFDPDGWNPRVSWINPETGMPGTQLVKAPGYDVGTVSDASDPQYGKKVIDSYEQVSFAPLLA